MKQKKKWKIAHSFRCWLLVLVVIALVASVALLWVIETHLAEDDAIERMRLHIRDVRDDIVDASNENLLKITRMIAAELKESGDVSSAQLETLTQRYDVTDINYIDQNGIIKASSSAEFVGYDMRSGEQSSEFLVLLSGTSEYVQSYRPLSYDSAISRKYGGVALEDGGFIQVGYGAQRFRRDINEYVMGVTRNRHIGKSGGLIIVDEAGLVVSDRNGYEGKNLSLTGIRLDRDKYSAGERFFSDVYGASCYCMYQETEGYTVVAFIPRSEVSLSRNVAVCVSTVNLVVLFAALFIIISLLVNRLVVKNLYKVNRSLSAISAGNLDTLVDVRSHSEFDALSNDINATVGTLKRYISDAAARFDTELAYAKAIQHSSLPTVFPPYPNRKEFSIYATMQTAKEVGGDFYDFYFVGEDTLVILVADVSDKGIPAAMFMMTAKTLLKSYAESGMSVEEVLSHANETLCQSNEAGMFVTAWMGFLNVRTGVMTYANAGHNPPLIKGVEGRFEYLRSRSGLVLAGMEGVRYRKHEIQLAPGDVVYLYTDGVTEAANENQNLYGEKRLREILNANVQAEPEAICNAVHTDVDCFTGTAPQCDDITMLALRFYGEAGRGAQTSVSELTVPAAVESMEKVVQFVNSRLVAFGCPVKARNEIDIAIDELFSNIAFYAYGSEEGSATVRVELNQAPRAVWITFIDKGIPFNPLSKTAPDVTLAAEQRDVGGLGIFVVQKIMDEVTYNHQNGQNILRIKKLLPNP